MYNVIRTDTFEEQLDLITHYIISEFADIDAAIDLVIEIDEAISLLEHYPRLGKKYESRKKLARIYRIKLVKNCKMLYTVDDEAQVVYLAHIFHDLQNHDDLLTE